MDEAREKWAALANAWSVTEPPASPSTDDLAGYMSFGPDLADVVAILGCTPTLREALRCLYPRVVALDISAEMLAVSRSALPEMGCELLMRCDWRALPVRDSSLAALFGDKVFGNVLPTDWHRWLCELRRVLRPGGSFVTRLSPQGQTYLAAPERIPFHDLVFASARAARDGTNLGRTCSALWERCMDMSTELLSAHAGTQQLARVVPAAPETCWSPFDEKSDEYALARLFVRRFWHTKDFRWSAYSETGVREAAAAAGLTFMASRISNDYVEASRQPIVHFVRV